MEPSSSSSSPSKHIVILPLNAQGHIIPSITLAQNLATRNPNFAITIATTPLNAHHFRSIILSANIQIAPLPFQSSDHGLPPHVENTDKLPFQQMLVLIQALIQTLAPHFEALLESLPERPVCVISDVCFGWAVGIARKFDIPSVTFSPAGAFGTTAFLSFWQNIPHKFYCVDDDEFTVPGLPDKYRFPLSYLMPFIREADGNDEWSRFFRVQLSLSLGADGWLCNTVEKIEGTPLHGDERRHVVEYASTVGLLLVTIIGKCPNSRSTFSGLGIELLRKYVKVPVWPIGPLLPSGMLQPCTNTASPVYGAHGDQQYGLSPRECIEWLDIKPPRSVIYISFGSQVAISIFHMMELAKGLIQSGRPFIWVVKPPLGYDKHGPFQPEWLPENFERNISESKQGLLIHNWAPQLEILSHKSTGAFVSHCGWNSLLECLSQGVPILGWPMVAEQVYNLVYLVEEMGVCVELAKGLQCLMYAEDVKNSIELIMNTSNEKGKAIREKTAQVLDDMRSAVRDDSSCGGAKGSSVQAMDDFLNAIQKK